MALEQQNKQKIVRVLDFTTAGTTDVNCTGVDMTGFSSVEFVAAFGTLTANQVTTLKAQQSDDDASSDDYSDLTGTQTTALDDDDDNDLVRLEVIRPLKRYVRCVVERGTANAVIDGVIAILSNPAEADITQDATVVVNESHVSPAEGTA